MEPPVATEQAPPARPPTPAPTDGAAAVGDIRSTRPYIPLRAGFRRAGSIISLIVLDLVGLVLGVYTALALRDLVYGKGVPLWGFLWKAETDWLPFLTVITVLVFWQAGLYAERERRGGFGRVVGSLVLVAVITLIFAIGTGHRFGTYGLAPEKFKKELDASGAWDKPIVTEIAEFKKFWKAEDYHQNYFKNNPEQGYCAYVIAPKMEKFRKVFGDKLKK